MPEGPIGVPRPLASGEVVLLMTVRNSTVDPKRIQRELLNEDHNVSVELDKSVDTYGINVGLTAISLNELEKLADDARKVYSGEIQGFSVSMQ